MEIKKHHSLLRRKIQINPKALFLTLGRAAVNGAFLQWDDLAENSVELLESLGLGKKPEEMAGLLIVRSLMQAMRKLTESNRHLLNEEPDKLPLQALCQQLNDSLETGEFTIDSNFFLRPQNHPFVREAEKAFAQWLVSLVEQPIEAENISRRLPAYFVFALHEEWREHSQYYIVLKEELDTPFTQAVQRERGWLRYRAWLQKQVEEPMLLESFSLQQVYIPLRAYYYQKQEAVEDGVLISNPLDITHQPQFFPIDEEEVRRKERGVSYTQSTKRIVVDLKEELEKWLKEENKNDAIRLLTGGPGSGKSSFTKFFAAWQAEDRREVLYIPLHRFRLADDLIKAVGDFIQFDGFLSENPLERDNQELRLLLIFDGLDELAKQGKIAQEAAREFVEEVRRQVGQFNYHKLRLQVIISGREVAIQSNRSQFRQPHQLLYLLPYFIPEYERKNYLDSKHLLQQDQRQDWWQRYGKAKGKKYSGFPSELNQNNLTDITVQPLLNYLLALSYERGKIQFAADTNLNEIYGDLLEAVYERKYEKRPHQTVTDISKDEFIGILEEIALSCWHGDGRTTTVKEIETHCDNSGVREILNRFQESLREDSKASITRLLTAFYFRESGDLRESEKTFEFTHKSFGEYLTAKRIVEGMQFIQEDLEARKINYRKGCDERQTLIKWAEMCGASAMDGDLFRFVVDEVELQDKEEVKKWQQTLCRLIEFVMINGMPMEGLNPRPSFHEEMRQSRNAEEALLAVLNACARATEEVSNIKWHFRKAFGTWIAWLQGQRTVFKNFLALDCLSFLNLQNCILMDRDFYGANLAEANLAGANLTGANLEKANLAGANLTGTNLEGAILKRANLEEAKLEGTNLAAANLERANLEKAKLAAGNFQRANLEGANLKKTNLQRAYLGVANLQQAHLEEADLENTNLVEAYLAGAHLAGANLKGAYLAGAHLAGAHLEGANLEWANLEGANLVGANLVRANLVRANLVRANLVRANLEGANLEGTILEGQDIATITGRKSTE